MSLSKDEFSVLQCVEHSGIRSVPEHLDNTKLCLLSDGLLSADGITSAGLQALEPYRVRRAVFFAAGFGVRMAPVTLDIPKPLVQVNGKRIIDTLLDAVLAAGIEEIWIVRGYMAERFDDLLEKYPMIRFLENTEYDKANNILSAYVARDKLQNAYVFESDLVLRSPQLLTKYQYESNYLGVPTKYTDDWCFTTDSNGRILTLRQGGSDCYHMFGISYLDESTGKKLETDIKTAFETAEGYKNRFWDDVALVLYADSYDIKIRPCSFDDVMELDTLDDLIAVDPSYARYKEMM